MDPTAGDTTTAKTKDILKTDPAKRRQAEMDLARMGMSPQEIARLLDGDTGTFDTLAVPEVPANIKQPQVKAELTIEAMRLQAVAREQERTQELVRRAQAVDLKLPPLREVSAMERGRAEKLLSEAALLRRRERPKEAEAKCREALVENPGDAAALELLGDLFQDVARIEEALAAYNRAHELQPTRTTAERKYGNLLTNQEQWSSLETEVIARSPGLALLLSLVLPGLGQFYNGEVGKGVLFVGLDFLVFYLLAYSPWGFPAARSHGGFSTGLVFSSALLIVIYLAGSIDAMSSARMVSGQSGRN